MSETFECGDTGALVAYLYEECEPEMREVIAGHLTRCESCSSEIDGLGWTRQRLEVWTPPDAGAGIPDARAGAGTRLPWWRAPLPAWAQAVAALLIFGVGLSRRSGARPGRRAAGVVDAAAPCRDDDRRRRVAHGSLAAEQRLKSEMAQMRTTASTVRQPLRQATASRRRDHEEG